MVVPSTFRGRPRLDPEAQTHSRFSAWFHGHSVIGDERSRASRASKFQRSRGRSTTHDRSANPASVSGVRSPSSTRSIIDPTSSPIVGSDPQDSGFLDRIHREEAMRIGGTRYDDENVVGATGNSGTRSRLILSRSRRKTAANAPRRRCFPSFKNNKVKRKAIGCIVSGGLLAIILTTYLALAISNSGNGETFHAILIILILIVTIIFCHYLIRLCMLAVRSKGRDLSGELVDQSRAGAIARPREPIRIILARDEELGLHERNVVEEDKEIAIPPPPPPAYGLWRCSVRADPNLIHWQRVAQPAIPEEAPSLMPDRGSLTRPPSYQSEHHGNQPVSEAPPPPKAATRSSGDSWRNYVGTMGAEPHSPVYNGVVGEVRTSRFY